MSAIDNQPDNKNFLSPLGYRFFIKKTPNVNWFVQSVELPSIQLARIDIQNPFIRFPVGGDHITIGELQISFRVDEDMSNYNEINNWMRAIGFPDNFEQYKSIAPVSRNGISGGSEIGTGEGIYSDASLIILTSAKNPNIEIKFFDLFPTGLSSLKFDTELTNINYLQATASFACRKFDVDLI